MGVGVKSGVDVGVGLGVGVDVTVGAGVLLGTAVTIITWGVASGAAIGSHAASRLTASKDSKHGRGKRFFSWVIVMCKFLRARFVDNLKHLSLYTHLHRWHNRTMNVCMV